METTLQCVVVTPERAVLDEPADFVVVPMYDGELGVAAFRQPLIGRLGFGELRITKDRQTRNLFVDGGFVQVRDNIVTVLTSKAVELKDINLAAAQATLTDKTVATTPESMEELAANQQRARVQIRLAHKARAQAG